uniref:BHLH domain-containing protein n=1 Tax=Brassica campestris TaxID=3711 RepID=M4DTS5_BRACM
MRRQRGRELGEGSSMSWKEQRNRREKERRMRMKHLFFTLSSHVSPTHRAIICRIGIDPSRIEERLRDIIF